MWLDKNGWYITQTTQLDVTAIGKFKVTEMSIKYKEILLTNQQLACIFQTHHFYVCSWEEMTSIIEMLTYWIFCNLAVIVIANRSITTKPNNQFILVVFLEYKFG